MQIKHLSMCVEYRNLVCMQLPGLWADGRKSGGAVLGGG